jgi:hypothetical protein
MNSPRTQHLATLTHEGRFWDVYLELDEPQGSGTTTRGRLAFSPGDGQQADAPLRTAPIFVEDSPEAAIARARALREHHLLSLLRSCMP